MHHPNTNGAKRKRDSDDDEESNSDSPSPSPSDGGQYDSNTTTQSDPNSQTKRIKSTNPDIRSIPSQSLIPFKSTSIPSDPLTHRVFNFIKKHMSQPNIEIEAKLGVLQLFNQATRSRQPIRFEGFEGEGTLAPGSFDHSFISDVGINTHRALNNFLNGLCSEQNNVRCKRSLTRDYFYPLPSSGNIKDKVRVSIEFNKDTKDEIGVKECIQKTLVENLDFYTSYFPLHYRMSAQREVEVDPEVLGLKQDAEGKFQGLANSKRPSTFRTKDRLSYSYKFFLMDLTYTEDQNSQKQFEMEVEINRDALEKWTGWNEDEGIWKIATALHICIRTLASMIPKEQSQKH